MKANHAQSQDPNSNRSKKRALQRQRRASSAGPKPKAAHPAGPTADPPTGPKAAPPAGPKAGPEPPGPASSSAGGTADVVPRAGWTVAAWLVTLFISLCLSGYEDGSRFRLCVASLKLRARVRKLGCAMSWG